MRGAFVFCGYDVGGRHVLPSPGHNHTVHPLSAASSPRSSGTGPSPVDSRLRALVDAPDDASAEAAIGDLLGGDAGALARDIVRRELLHSPAGAAYIDDVLADVRLRLMRKLARLRPTAGEDRDEPVENFLAYVSVVAENACYAFLRAQYPERTRFRNRIRYAIGHHPTTALTRDGDGQWRCASTRAVRKAPAAGASERFLDDPGGWLSHHDIQRAQALPALLDELLASLERPVELDRLVDALAIVLGVVDLQPASPRDDAGPALEAVDPAPAVSDVLEHREALVAAWAEIVELPTRQRAALLLNLRDPDGGAILHILPGTGVVSMEGIAAALEIDGPMLEALWVNLPLDDLSIAAQLGLTRQQVINLRKSARARLARRLRGSA